MRYQDSNLQDRLASEYVMGTMTARVNRRFEKLMQQYPEIQQFVDSWADHLQPLNDKLSPVTPPDGLWQSISNTIEQEKKINRSSNIFYRNFAMVAASVLLVATLMFIIVEENGQSVRHITNAHNEVTWVFKLNADSHQLYVKTLAPVEMSENKHCVLWLIRNNAKPHKISVLPDMPGEETWIYSDALFTGNNNAHIVVSLEPVRNKMDQPRGKIIYQGPWSI